MVATGALLLKAVRRSVVRLGAGLRLVYCLLSPGLACARGQGQVAQGLSLLLRQASKVVAGSGALGDQAMLFIQQWPEVAGSRPGAHSNAKQDQQAGDSEA